MSVTTTATEVEYTGSGVATTFPVPFPFFEADDLVVTVGGAVVSFTVTGSPRTAAASVVISPAPTGAVLIRRALDVTQPTTFGLQGTFSPKSHEAAFDRAVMLVQDEAADRVAGDAASVALVAAEEDRALAAESAIASSIVSAVAAEATVRAAADAAIIASGDEPANVGVAPVIATGTTQPVAVADRFAREVWLEDFGEAGTGDWTAILLGALQFLHDNGGGTLRLRARTYLLLGQIRLPWDPVPVGSIGQAPSVRIVGQGRYFSQYNRLTYDSGTFLDMRYDASTTPEAAGRWEGDAAGVISFEFVNFVDRGAAPNSTTFFITSYAPMIFNNCSIVGDLHDGFPDAIRLGGNNGPVTQTQDILFGYQAYGSQVRNCFFDRIGRALYCGLYCNQAIFDGNLVWMTCSGTAIIELNSTLTSGTVDNANSGIQITNNYIELVNHDYAIKITTKGVGHFIANNGFYDIGVGRQPLSVYYVGPNCTGIFILSTGPLGGLTAPLITGAGAFDGSTTLISSQVNQDTYLPSNVKLIGEAKILSLSPALLYQDSGSNKALRHRSDPNTGVMDLDYLATPASAAENMFQFHRQSASSRRFIIKGAGPHSINAEGTVYMRVPDAEYWRIGTESHPGSLVIGDLAFGVFGYGPAARQTVAGLVASATTVADLKASLGSLLDALAQYGLINNTTT